MKIPLNSKTNTHTSSSADSVSMGNAWMRLCICDTSVVRCFVLTSSTGTPGIRIPLNSTTNTHTSSPAD